MPNSSKSNHPLNFDKAGYYLIALLILALLGFWPTYFAQYFGVSIDSSIYIHFHAAMMLIWILMLISQPLLLRFRKPHLHRFIGKFSYVVFPMVILSVIFLAHSRIPFVEEGRLTRTLFIPFKDITVLLVAFSIAIWNRKDPTIHARGMIATAIPFIEPALVRFNYSVLPPMDIPGYGYILTVIIMDLILLILIFKERNQAKGRWVFPLILGLYFLIQFLIFAKIKLPLWQSICNWFASLPLT